MTAMEKSDKYEKILDGITYVRNRTQKKLSQFEKASELLEAVRNRMSIAENKGINIIDIQKKYSQAESSFTNNDYYGCIKKIEHPSNGLFHLLEKRQDMYNDACKSMEYLDSVVDRCKSTDCVLPKGKKEEYKGIKSSFKNGSYSEVIERTRTLRERLEDLLERYTNAVDIMDKMDRRIEEVKGEGCKLEYIEEAVVEVRAKFENGDYEAAIKGAQTNIRKTEKRMDSFRRSKGLLSTARSTLEKASKVDCIGEKKSARFSVLETEFEEGRYEKVIESAEEFIADLENAMKYHSKASRAMGALERKVEIAKGDNLPIPDDLLKGGKDLFDSKNYEKSFNLIRSAIEELDHTLKSYDQAKTKLEEAERKVEEASEKITVEEIGKDLVKARKLFEQKDFSGTSQKAEECIEELERTIRENKPMISVSLPSEVLKTGVWNRCVLTVYNTGRVHVEKVDVELKGAISTQGNLSTQKLKAGEQREIDISIKSDEKGTIPVTIGADYQGSTGGGVLNYEETAWLNVGEKVGITTERGEQRVKDSAEVYETREDIEKELVDFKGEEKMIDVRGIEDALSEDDIERAGELMLELKEKYGEYKQVVEELRTLDKRKSSLAEKLADGDIDRKTFNDARRDIEEKKYELEMRYEQLQKMVIYEDYQKPF